MRSNLPSAERFQDWVFEEVLPSIRKTGKYQTPSKATASDPRLVMAELNIAEQLLLEMGIDTTIVKQLKFDNAIAYLPNAKQMLEAGKKFIASSDPLDTVGMNVTQVGEHLNPTLKATEVNNLLEKMGLQYKVTRTSTRTGKLKYFWQVTEEGEKYSVVHKVTNSNTEWNGNQIKWQKSVVTLIQENLDSK
jgi:phenylalanyl-tRNA synthetase beta subunit